MCSLIFSIKQCTDTWMCSKSRQSSVRPKPRLSSPSSTEKSKQQNYRGCLLSTKHCQCKHWQATHLIDTIQCQPKCHVLLRRKKLSSRLVFKLYNTKVLYEMFEFLINFSTELLKCFILFLKLYLKFTHKCYLLNLNSSKACDVLSWLLAICANPWLKLLFTPLWTNLHILKHFNT